MQRATENARSLFASALIASLMLAPLAYAQTFTNSQPITIRDANIADPFPSTITVIGVSQPASAISVTLINAAHTWTDDLQIGLQGPDGTVYAILSDCGSSANLAGNYTFVVGRPAPPLAAPGFAVIPPGEYAPSVCGPGLSLSTVPGFRGNLTDLVGSANVNGTWSLYIADDTSLDAGNISGGWSITFEPPTTPTYTSNSIIYQGRLEVADTPAQDEFIAQFRLYDAPAGGNFLGFPVVARIIPTDGLFTVPLDFQNPAVFDGTPRWLDIEIDGVPILPRQPLALAPRAFHARNAARATLADSATTATTATNSTNATIATTATTANSVPWSGITNLPNNVADLRLAPATLANSALINGGLGLGAEPLASSRLHALVPSVGATDWHIELTNNTIPAFRGGIRINNAGFLDITNNATSAVGFFARLNSTGAWTVASDARLKTDIRPAVSMLDAALKLRPVYFHWLNEDAGPEDFGLIAQEVRDVLPRLVTGVESKDTLTVNYSQLSVVAIGAVQELQAQVDTLRAENDDLRAQLEAQQQQINDLARILEAAAPSKQ